MRPLDCTDIKVLLSGLVDGELPDAERHAAERHIVECAACRTLVDETEALGALIAADVADLDATPLSDDFVGAVLGRTVYVGATRRAGRSRWTSWLGWVAAAATLLLAASLWVLLQLESPPTNVVRAPERAERAEPRPIAAPKMVSRKTYLQSSVLDGATPVVETRPGAGATRVEPTTPGLENAARAATPPSESASESASEAESTPAPETDTRPAPELVARPVLSRDDAETLDGASLLLEMLLSTTDDTFAGVEEIRRIAEYDELLPRLADTRARLHADDRPAVFACESILVRLMYGPLSHEDVRELRQTVRRSDLEAQLLAIGRRRGAAL